MLSAGILLFRRREGVLEVFLVHPGGPFWVRKDLGAWSLPKGLVEAGEDLLVAARREVKEETGLDVAGRFHDLGEFRLPGGKRLHVWTIEKDYDPANLKSNLFEMVWPPKSGQARRFPEVDRGAWFDRAEALKKVHKGQRTILESFFAGFAVQEKA
ncbi:MAG: NUDIX domain-containing protein [Rhizomicrobium sp.]